MFFKKNLTKKLNKCIIKKTKKKFEIVKKSKELKRKLSFTKIKIPLWIMKNLADSAFCIVVVPKNIRRNINQYLNIFWNFCFFSAIILFKNLPGLKYLNFFKNTLILKFKKIIEFIMDQNIETLKIDIVKKEACIYENILIQNLIFSKIKIFKWKKNGLKKFL